MAIYQLNILSPLQTRRNSSLSAMEHDANGSVPSTCGIIHDACGMFSNASGKISHASGKVSNASERVFNAQEIVSHEDQSCTKRKKSRGFTRFSSDR